MVSMVVLQDKYETIFKKYDPRGNGTLTIDEWIKLATEEVFKTIVSFYFSVTPYVVFIQFERKVKVIALF